jgi:hypothetical protein
MDVLKYLDVLIGLAVVMVLLSPLVSAGTQFVMWGLRIRPWLLRIGITRLILHLDGNPFAGYKTALIKVMNGANAVPNADVFIPNTPRGRTDLNGELLVNDIDAALSQSQGQLVVSIQDATGTPLQNHDVTVTLVPAGGGIDTVITSPPTGAAGTTKITYGFTGSAALASTIAEVRTTDSGGNGVASNVSCVIRSGPDAGATIPVQTSLLQTTAGGSGMFRYPKDSSPASYELELAVANTSGAPRVGYNAVFRFLRNRSQDRTVAGKTGPEGVVTLPAAPGMGATLSEDDAAEIAKAVLMHPMVSSGASPANVIQREELTGILLDLADDGSQSAKGLLPPYRQALQTALAANGILNPGRTLADIRATSQTLEKNEPGAAAHLRAAEAIITSAQSDYVGKINYWFDQTMDRITQRYAFHARVFTVFGAAIVAFAIQFDSVDLLKRLSTDSKLRDSLLNEATAQQNQIDKINDNKKAGNPPGEQSELELATAKRNEIEQDLATLRAPGLAIFPDHFIWQKLPRARLIRNETWKRPYADRLELALGTAVFEIAPRWGKDPLTDLKTAIDGSGAPVITRIERAGDYELVLKSDGATRPTLKDDKGKEMTLAYSNEVAQARLFDDDDWLSEIGDSQQMQLFVGNKESKAAPVLAGKPGTHFTRATVIPALARAIESVHAGVIVTPDTKNNELLLTAADPNTSWLELRWQKDDSLSNILTDTKFVPTVGRVSVKALGGIEKANDRARQINKTSVTEKVTASVQRPDALIVSSGRLGVIQLRWRPGRPETNMLNSVQEDADWDWGAVEAALPGILVSWALLSLGAPFWYDALKGLLKLRPLLAGKDDDQRSDRQTDTRK